MPIVNVWYIPAFTGNDLPIQTYTITIPEIDYTKTVDCIDSCCSLITIRVDGEDDNVKLNTSYSVYIITNNTCGYESSPTLAGIVGILAHGEFIISKLKIH